MDETIKENLKEKSTWKRALYMLLYAVCYSIAELLLFAIVIFQFILMLFTRQPNERLLKLGQSLSTYVYQVLVYLTYNADYQPYPMGAWPKGSPSAAREKKKSMSTTQDETES